MPTTTYYSPSTAGSGSTTSVAVWEEWSSEVADVTTAASAGVVWRVWTNASCAIATVTTADRVWASWSSTASTNTVASCRPVTLPPPAPPAPEELERQRLARKRRAAEAAEAERKRQEADRRAAELLRQHLDDEQKKQYARDRSFVVYGEDGQRYRVRDGWAGHVERLGEDGLPVERFCIHPSELIPIPDNQLIAKLMLETDAQRFRQIANVTRLRPEPARAGP